MRSKSESDLRSKKRNVVLNGYPEKRVGWLANENVQAIDILKTSVFRIRAEGARSPLVIIHKEEGNEIK